MVRLASTLSRRTALAALAGVRVGSSKRTLPAVRVLRVPDGGIQPQVARSSDGLHLLGFSGPARGGNLYHQKSVDGGQSFSDPLLVNSQAGSAVAAGTIRGGQIAVDPAGTVHVVWNGAASRGQHAPLLYSRLRKNGQVFEPQRNLMKATSGLDGGSSIAAAPDGRVVVSWHGHRSGGGDDEGSRQVFITQSMDSGANFGTEMPVWDERTGACACCGMRIFVGRDGETYLMYRSAKDGVHRDMYLLQAPKRSIRFSGNVLHRWDVNACPMSSASFSQGSDTEPLAAWETDGQVYFSSVSSRRPVAASPTSAKGKHPVTASDEDGNVLIAWVEGSGWQKSGLLAWRLFDPKGFALTDVQVVGECPAWSFPAVYPHQGGFNVLY